MQLTPPESESSQSPLVLIVAPDWETGRFLRARLTTQGLDAFIALSMADAMELLEIHLCDIVIVDTTYFGPAAEALFQHLRARSADVCLVSMGALRPVEPVVDVEILTPPDASSLHLALGALRSRRCLPLMG